MIPGNLVHGQSKGSDVDRRLSEIIAQASFTRMPADAIRKASALSEIGIDSLAFIEVIINVEEEFGIVVADQDLAMERFDTVESLRDYILARVPDTFQSSEPDKATEQ